MKKKFPILAVTALAFGCEIGSKSVGMETESGSADDGASSNGDGDGDGDGVGDDDPGDDGQTSAGPTTTDPMPGTDDGSSTGPEPGDSGDDGSCPPNSVYAEPGCGPAPDGMATLTEAGCYVVCEGEGSPCGDGVCVNTWTNPCICPAGEDCCAACGGEQLLCLTDVPLTQGFEVDLTVQGGCGDMRLSSNDGTDTVGMVLNIDAGLVQSVIDSGTPLDTEIDAADPSVELSVRTGMNVTLQECNDVLVKDVVFEQEWIATAGTLVVHIEPDGEFANADVELVDVVIERQLPSPAEPITISSYAFLDIFVGWLPG